VNVGGRGFEVRGASTPGFSRGRSLEAATAENEDTTDGGEWERMRTSGGGGSSNNGRTASAAKWLPWAGGRVAGRLCSSS
jgi:hypothetical protein